MVKKILISFLVMIAIIVAAVFVYRYQIFQYSAENLIRKYIPDYIKIDKIRFELKDSAVIVENFRILNPEGYSSAYLIEISEIVCKYKMKGKNFLDGIEILEPLFKKPVLNIERLRDGKINITQMQSVIQPAASRLNQPQPEPSSRQAGKPANIKISDIVKIPETFKIVNGKTIIIDRLPNSTPYTITFEDVNSTLSLKLDETYSKPLRVGTVGQGFLSGDKSEVIKWNINWDPTTPKLSMSNRFEVSGLDILTFEPYYDKYSPFVFKKGKFSGTLIFDFDNGNIGSTNEVHLTDFNFYIKKGYENAQFWETTVPDLAKYFTSSFGEIIFDFKIKGDMENPQFYLGPISKQAVASMAIDKISSIIESSGKSGKASDQIDKAKEYIDLFKTMIKKQ